MTIPTSSIDAYFLSLLIVCSRGAAGVFTPLTVAALLVCSTCSAGQRFLPSCRRAPQPILRPAQLVIGVANFLGSIVTCRYISLLVPRQHRFSLPVAAQVALLATFLSSGFVVSSGTGRFRRFQRFLRTLRCTHVHAHVTPSRVTRMSPPTCAPDMPSTLARVIDPHSLRDMHIDARFNSHMHHAQCRSAYRTPRRCLLLHMQLGTAQSLTAALHYILFVALTLVSAETGRVDCHVC